MSLDIQTIIDDFAFLDDWEDRYRYLIDLGRELEPLADIERSDRTRVQGCVSQVWLVSEPADGPDPVLVFRGDSDAHIVRGLVAVMLALYSGRHAGEILDIDAEQTLRTLGLDEHLTPQRANGLRAMIDRIRKEAAAAREAAA
ncbi:MAG: SufE family protein [Rhizobiaceae bacterium]